MSEIHVAQYDRENHVSIEAHDAEAVRILAELGAEHLRDTIYRLPVEEVPMFWVRRFKLDVITCARPTVTHAQRTARRQNMAAARAVRWAKQEQQ